MMKHIILLIVLILPTILFTQEQSKISLEECYELAIKNYPLFNQKELIQLTAEIKQKSIKSGLSPQATINGQITYQSEVTQIPINLPSVDIERLNKDWYRLSLDVSQLIYDGGAIKIKQQIEESGAKIELQNIEIELFKLKEVIKSSYFNITFLKENKQIFNLLKDELNQKLNSVNSAINNGIMLPSYGDNLKAEIINIDQKLTEIELGIESSINILNILTKQDYSKVYSFIIPEISLPVIELQNRRPELKLFELQSSKINLLKNMTGIKRKPIVMGFGQAGYARPALNMLSNEFEPYFVVGAKLSWKVFDWENSKNERKILDIQQLKINNQSEAFKTTIDLVLAKKRSEITRLESLLKSDQELVFLRKKIAMATSSQFENGIITASEYITEKNAEAKALVNLQLHKIQLANAKIDYLYILGN
ncbi:MAG: TolC family protein [Bacteroidetes bacterium]|nr:TolC family protein [Bacteroidota bacterium]